MIGTTLISCRPTRQRYNSDEKIIEVIKKIAKENKEDKI